jgi:hypothetical protein
MATPAVEPSKEIALEPSKQVIPEPSLFDIKKAEHAAEYAATQELMAATYAAMTPEQRAAEYKAKMAIMEATTKLQAEMNALIEKPLIEFVAFKRIDSMIERLSSLWCSVMSRVDNCSTHTLIFKAKLYAMGAVGKSTDYRENRFLEAAKTNPNVMRQIRLTYLMDAEYMLSIFNACFAPVHPAIQP